jgi:lactoylglutathione lyase
MRTAGIVGAKITVSDLSRTLDFYQRIVGMVPVRSRVMPEPDFAPDVAGTQAGLNFATAIGDTFLVVVRRRGESVDPAHAALTTVVIRVRDLRAVVEGARSEGARILTGYIENNGSLFAFVSDPDGYTLELFETDEWPPDEAG